MASRKQQIVFDIANIFYIGNIFSYVVLCEKEQESPSCLLLETL